MPGGNLIYTVACEIASVVALPRKDIMTQSLRRNDDASFGVLNPIENKIFRGFAIVLTDNFAVRLFVSDGVQC